jgi:hypothetical protein
MSRIVLFVAAALCAAGAQAEDPPAPGAEAPAVTVPTFANANCPIMGKRVSLKLFVDTPKGRIYMCCVRCTKEIRKDPDRAHAAAYPKRRTFRRWSSRATRSLSAARTAPRTPGRTRRSRW